MDIPNLNQNPPLSSPPKSNLIYLLAITLTLALASGFWLSRFFPLQKKDVSSPTFTSGQAQSTDKISSADQLKVGQIYGNTTATFADSATGTIEVGGVNGEGTHTLVRPGGEDQKAALTSSVVDLDLFVGRQVEIKGETNSSRKAGWFLDVGSIKIIE
ncbi:hypothetical protein KJ909_03180 [Patescibacteria group bacterium]|nr:hypothetical protein [Patescibacteria group bacterium]